MSVSQRLAAHWYRRLLRLQPPSVRRRFAGDMTDLFVDLVRDAERTGGQLAVARLMTRAAADAVTSALTAHREAPDGLLRRQLSLPPMRLIARSSLAELANATRTLRRAPTFAAIAIVTLGLGIAASVTAFSVVNAYLIRALPFPHADRLVWVSPLPFREAFDQGVRPPDDLQSLNMEPLRGTFAEMAAWDLDGFTLVGAGEPAYVDGAWVSSGFFRTLGVSAALGRVFDDREAVTGAPVAVISHALWQRQFGGDPDVIGRTMTAYSTDRPRERALFTIIGVLPAEFWHFNRFTDVLVPLQGERAVTIARLREGITIEDAEHRLNAVARAQFPTADPRWKMSLTGAREEHVHRVRPTLLVALAAVGFVMLVACANVASLLIARAVDRRRELAVRAALGAARTRLMAQFVAESAVLALCATAIGVSLAWIALDLLGPVVAEQLPATVPGGAATLAIDGAVLAFSATLAVATLAASGLLPAVIHTNIDPARSLAESRTSTASHSRARTRSVLVGAQLAVSLALLCGALMLVRTTREMQRLDLGFDPRQVTKASVLLPLSHYPDSAQRTAFVTAVLDHLQSSPEIVSATVANSYPFRDGGPRPVAAEGASDTTLSAVHYVIGPSYLETVRVPLLRGRAFDARDDAAGPLVALVSHSFAERAWPAGEALGKRIKLGGTSSESPWRTIVGVVQNTRKNLTAAPAPDVYFPYAQDPRAYFYLIARSSGSSQSAAARMREAVRAIDERQPLADVATLTTVLEEAGASHRFLALLLTGFSVFTVALATLGMYGVLSYVVTSRRQEIAVRIAFGARAADLLGMIARQAVPILIVGMSVGTWLSVLVGRTLASAIEGVQTSGIMSLIAVDALLTVVAMLAILVPARRATETSPMLILRE
ncbi:MAG TPA: ABC transporter permease [Gemmatimonadaceae bacterium]|nr:ABC transporter permease [Gemmatimonadaceae bacterium]